MTAANEFQLSVIIPVYNEQSSLRNNVQCVLAMNDQILCEVILIVSSFASKETMEVCRELRKQDPRIIYQIQKKNPGLGYALREGFAMAKGTHIQILYADCESDPEAIPRFIQAAKGTGADVVVGSRWVKEGNVQDYPPVRYFFNRAYQIFFRLLFLTKLHDLTFGYNLGKAETFRNIHWQGKMHEITTEMVLKAIKLHYKVEEIPVVWKRRKEGRSTLSKVRYMLYPFMALFILLCPRKYLGIPKVLN